MNAFHQQVNRREALGLGTMSLAAVILGGSEHLSSSPSLAATAGLLSGIAAGPLDWTPRFTSGVVVRDLEASMRQWAAITGVRRWFRKPITRDCLYRGQPSAVRSSNAFAALPPLGSPLGYVELVQPLAGGGDFSATAWLAERGEGIYHISYPVPDVTAGVAAMAVRGICTDTLDAGAAPGFTYLDTRDQLGFHLELVRAADRAPLYDSMAKAPLLSE